MVEGHLLPAEPTLTNMSRSELSFSLLVEEMLHQISLPERRQLAVECLCIVATILSRNPELRFTHVLDLGQLIQEAYNMYCKDHNLALSDGVSLLYTLPYAESTGYLARAAVNSVLHKAALLSDGAELVDDACRVS